MGCRQFEQTLENLKMEKSPSMGIMMGFFCGKYIGLAPRLLVRLKGKIMKGIHPNYREVLFVDLSNGFKFVTRSCVNTKKPKPTKARNTAVQAGYLF